jgi:septum formation inhibitor MinC
MTEDDRERFIRALVAIEHMAPQLVSIDKRLSTLEKTHLKVVGAVSALSILTGVVVKFL